MQHALHATYGKSSGQSPAISGQSSGAVSLDLSPIFVDDDQPVSITSYIIINYYLSSLPNCYD